MAAFETRRYEGKGKRRAGQICPSPGSINQVGMALGGRPICRMPSKITPPPVTTFLTLKNIATRGVLCVGLVGVFGARVP